MTLLGIILFLLLLLLILGPIILCKLQQIRKKQRDTITISELVREGRTGDILLFSDNRRIISKGSRFLFGCEFTHVGILVIREGLAYVWEFSSPPEVCNLLLLEDKLNSYIGYCVARFLSPSIEDILGKEEVERRLNELFNSLANKEFYVNFPSFALAILQDRIWLTRRVGLARKPCGNDWVCTDIVKKTYEILDIWKDTEKTRSFSFPIDYTFPKFGRHEIREEKEIVI